MNRAARRMVPQFMLLRSSWSLIVPDSRCMSIYETCDASHFGLGEYDPDVHTNSPLALRKVFEYIDE